MDTQLVPHVRGADLDLKPGDLVQDQGLETAVILSLFSNARDGEGHPEDPQGWWADDEADRWGSLLWTLIRQVGGIETAERARIYTQSALDWLVQEGVVESIEAQASFDGEGRLMLDVTLRRGSAERWHHVWRAFEQSYQIGEGALHLQAI